MSVGQADPAAPLDRIREHLALVANRDLYDPDHIDEVAELSVRIATRLGVPDDGVAEVEQVARLRDVGKAMVPIAVLRKQEPLDDAEWALLKRYPEHGAVLVAGTPGWQHLSASVRASNERWDGAGYPDGLAGEQIPQASRITYVGQAYLAMLADRPYRRAVSRAAAIVEIAGVAGGQFDPAVVTALVELLLDEPSKAPAAVAAATPEPTPTPAPLPAEVPAPVRASVARSAAAARPRAALRRAIAGLGALAGAGVGLALVLPLPTVAEKCPPGGEGRSLCEIKDIFVPAVTIAGFCALVGSALLVALLIRLPRFLGRPERAKRHDARQATPAFAADPILSAATWGMVYDDEDTALRAVGRRRWRVKADPDRGHRR
jgi:hypothetical protein